MFNDHPAKTAVFLLYHYFDKDIVKVIKWMDEEREEFWDYDGGCTTPVLPVYSCVPECCGDGGRIEYLRAIDMILIGRADEVLKFAQRYVSEGKKKGP